MEDQRGFANVTAEKKRLLILKAYVAILLKVVDAKDFLLEKSRLRIPLKGMPSVTEEKFRLKDFLVPAVKRCDLTLVYTMMLATY